MKAKLLLMLLLAVVLSTSAGAVEITIVNPGFEDPALNDGQRTLFTTGWQEGWYDLTSSDPNAWGGIPWAGGAINPNAAYGYGGFAPEGENVAFTTSDAGYDDGLRQILQATLQAGMTYELSALVGNPSVYNGGTTADYRIELVAGGIVVAMESGPSPANDTYWTTASLSFTPDGSHPQLGKLLEIRLIAVDLANYYEVNFDDIRLNAYSDPMNPSPYDGQSVYGGDVELSWTNMDPNEGVTDVYVDVWFGVNPDNPNKPGNWTKVVDGGENTTSVTVKAPVVEPAPTTYYWQVNSYIYGADANMIEGRLYTFYATTDLPLESVDAGSDMITWEGQGVQLDGTVVDDGKSELTYSWSAAPSVGVVFSATDVEDPIVTISKPGVVPIANAGFEDPERSDGNYGYNIPGWGWVGQDWVGNWNPTVYSVVPEGEHIGFAEAYGVETGFAQILTETLAAETTYTLIVEVGNSPGYDWDGYKVQLLAGGTGTAPGEITGGALLAEDDNTLFPASGTFETSTVVYTCGVSDPSVGQPIQIRLIANKDGEEVDFDDVRLYTLPPRGPSPDVHNVELTLVVNDELNTTPVEDSMTIDVYEDACEAARLALGLAAGNIGDINADCITDLEDLALALASWLNDTGLIEPVSITVPSANADLIDGLVEYWGLDGDYSAEVTDSHVGTLQTTGLGSGTFVTGKFGQGIDLENSSGNQAYIVIGGDENDFDFAGQSMSISLWYTIESLYTGWQCLAAKGEGSSWRLHRNSNSNYGSTTTDINFHTSINVTGYGALDQQDGSWHHVVATADAVNGGSLYVDGSLVDSVSGSIAIVGNDVAMQIAGNPGAAGRGWDGILDDVGIWNRALTSDEVSLIWNGGAGISIGNITGISPYDGETVMAGDVDLSWTNLDPWDPNDSVWVDVWFGTDLISDYTKVVEAGENTTTVQVNAPVIGETYYWQVDSYLDGSPTGDPNVGDVWVFYVADLPPSVEAGDDMITWSGQEVQLAPTVVDNDLSGLTYAWSAEPDTGVVFSDDEIEAPTVTITKAGGDAATVTLTLEVDDSVNPPVTDVMTIDVYDNNCLAAKAAGLAETDAGDFDADCDTDIEDFVEMALTWLVDYELTEPVILP